MSTYLRVKICDVEGFFYLKCKRQYVIPNQSLIYDYISEIFKIAFKPGS